MARGQVVIGRFMWWPPWSLSDPWLPRIWHGADEWCRPSDCLTVPLLGCLIVFKGPRRAMPCGECWEQMDGEQQAAYLPGGWLEGGRVHKDSLIASRGSPPARGIR